MNDTIDTRPVDVLIAEADQLERASLGDRNDQLHRSLLTVLPHVQAGTLRRDGALDVLVAAALKAGLEPLEIERTVRNAWPHVCFSIARDFEPPDDDEEIAFDPPFVGDETVEFPTAAVVFTGALTSFAAHVHAVRPDMVDPGAASIWTSDPSPTSMLKADLILSSLRFKALDGIKDLQEGDRAEMGRKVGEMICDLVNLVYTLGLDVEPAVRSIITPKS